MKRLRIHREGRLILTIVLLVLFTINVLAYLHWPTWIFALNLTISAVLLVFFTYFFRNPVREVEVDDPGLIVAPADGTVVVIEPTEEQEYFRGEKKLQVSIFMSVFNVHANWYPISGKIIEASHQNGSHAVAWLPKSSTENERSTVVIETESKAQILVRQIAGALARRIVTYAKVGHMAHLNEQLGFIKFGSRVDLFLPPDAEVFVEIGDKTIGNETIIARIS